jgi:hypothetical protein
LRAQISPWLPSLSRMPAGAIALLLARQQKGIRP